MVALTTPEEAQSSAGSIDERGLIAGSVQPRFGEARGLVWNLDGSVARQLTTFDPNARQQDALAIVDGRVVGFESSANFVSVPMQWDENGVPTPLPQNGDAIARALSATGLIGGDEGSRPVVWRDGQQIMLPLPPGASFGIVTAAGGNTVGGIVEQPSRNQPALWNCS